MTDAEIIAALTAQVADLQAQLTEAQSFVVASREAHRQLLLTHHGVKAPILAELTATKTERDELLAAHEPERLPVGHPLRST